MPPEFLTALCRALDQNHQHVTLRPISGGDISTAVALIFPNEQVFVKYGGVDAEAFSAESAGLEALANCTSSLLVPRPIAHGELSGLAFLAMEMLTLTPKSVQSDRAMGQGLAELHAHRCDSFGWSRNNRIGATPQPNPRYPDWIAFFIEQRLLHQAILLGDRVALQGIEKISKGIERLFSDFTPFPSLLHGDLWGGNYAASGHRAVIFDPACYHGCRETDLAMTELFGGFGPDFYAAYNAIAPLDNGYPCRRQLYQLYHILNHANLFGGAYLRQVHDQLERISHTIAAHNG